MRLKILRWISVAAWLIGSLGLAAPAAAPVAAQTGTPTFFITNVNPKAFPQVTFSARAVNESNLAVGNLASTLTVYENGQLVPAANVQVTAHDDGPVTYIFVVDQGRYANYNFFGKDSTRQIFSALTQGGFFVDGRDTVEVLVRENVNSDRTEIRLPATTSKSQFENWIATYPFERQSADLTRGLEAIGDALTEAAKVVNPPGAGTVGVIFLTRRIEDPITSVAVQAAEKWAREARSKFVTISALEIDSTPSARQPVETLTQGTSGQYVALNRSNVPTLVGPVYTALNAQRAYYTVSFTSTLNSSDKRLITLNTAQPAAAGVAGAYQVNVQPPTLSFAAPTPGANLTRAPLVGGGYPPLQVTVSAQVAWPDNFPRSVRTAQLLVNGEVKDSAQPAPGATQVSFTADLSSLTTPGPNPVTLAVKIVDTLGLEASASTQVTVTVVEPPTPIPTSTPVPTPAISETTVGLAVGGAICGGIVVLAAAGAGLFFFLRRRTAAAVPPPAPPISPQETVIVSRSRRAQATLTVLEGPPARINEVIWLIKPVSILGRNAEAADVVFFANEESSVSRVHCAIQQEADQSYRLVDRGSTSGTRLNGKAVLPNTPQPLADGAEIILGDLSKRGVRLRFNLAGGADAAQTPEAGEDRTRVVRKPPSA